VKAMAGVDMPPQLATVVSGADGRMESPESRQLAKALREAGFRLVGPVVAHSFMQSVGIENGHFQGCFRALP